MKVLIAEDDFVSRKMIKKIIEPYAECDFALDGREALVAIADGLNTGAPYDLICLDIHMPNLTGLQVLASLREAEQDRGIGGLQGAKVLMVTGESETKVVLGAFRAGCEGYIVKPLDPTKILAKLQEFGFAK